MNDNVAFLAKTEQMVFEFCTKQKLFPQGATVYVALSGGADSMSLLKILLVLAPNQMLSIHACHVNHGMRGAQADADEQFVRAQCDALSVPLIVFNAQADGNLPPVQAGEMWARSLRYTYFETLLTQPNVLIATAHTLNDQAETLLFRLARGTGMHGAAGIRPCRDCYVRPLLCLTRAEVEAYCACIGQEYVTDETNYMACYARNHLRQYALPSLCYANESAVAHLGQFCEKMAQVDLYFARLAEELLVKSYRTACGMTARHSIQTVLSAMECQQNLSFSIADLRQADSLVLSQAMYQLVCPLRDPEQKYVQALCALVVSGSGAVQITDEVRFVIDAGNLKVIYTVNQPVQQAQFVEYYPIQLGRYQFPGGYCLEIKEISPKNMEKIHLVHKKDLKNYADYDKIVASLTLRCRAQGDTFAPVGRGLTKTVKKWHNEYAVPEQERCRQPLLADGHTVVWLWGHGFAQGYTPNENTKRIVKITEEKYAEELYNDNKHGQRY
ncbi:MAG: tRNA lysidine(34) synthetase TilS [Faecalibacterium sp.]